MRGCSQNECVSDIHKWRFFFESRPKKFQQTDLRFGIICRQYFCHKTLLFVIKEVNNGFEGFYSKTDPCFKLMSPVERAGRSLSTNGILTGLSSIMFTKYTNICMKIYHKRELPRRFRHALIFLASSLSSSLHLSCSIVSKTWQNHFQTIECKNFYEFFFYSLYFTIAIRWRHLSFHVSNSSSSAALPIGSLCSANGNFTSIIFLPAANAHNP